MLGRWIALSIALLAGSAQAQEPQANGVLRALEMPAHHRLMALVSRADTTLSPFETDGCSGGLSEVWQAAARQFPAFDAAFQSQPPWEACCVKHDRAYHTAGGALEPSESFKARLRADLILQSCVAALGVERADTLADLSSFKRAQIVASYDSIATAMFGAVRIGGMPCTGLPWRWGYGYPDCTR